MALSNQESTGNCLQSKGNSNRTTREQITAQTNAPTTIPVKKVHFWQTDRVLIWLKKYCSLYYSDYCDLFHKNEITGRILITLTDQKLLRLGITNSVHRKEILIQILKLKLTWDKYQLQELQTNFELDAGIKHIMKKRNDC